MKTLLTARGIVGTNAIETFEPSEAWKGKMALLEEIHSQIAPDVLALRSVLDEVIEPSDLLDLPTVASRFNRISRPNA